MNIYTIPSYVLFTLPFSDSSGNRHEVSFKEGSSGIMLSDVDKTVLIEPEYIDWIIDALRDAKNIVTEKNKKQKNETI